jgi:hypothetical protein
MHMLILTVWPPKLGPPFVEGLLIGVASDALIGPLGDVPVPARPRPLLGVTPLDICSTCLQSREIDSSRGTHPVS